MIFLNDRFQANAAPPFGRMKRRQALMIPAVLWLAGCAQQDTLPDLPPATGQVYHLGAGDKIRVITYDESQLSNDFTVGADGTIAFPLIGTVQASGLTVHQLASSITQSLEASKLLSSPSVSVEVTTFRPISVLGEVNRPGQYPYQPGMTMLDAVALAGGFTYRAVTDYASDWRTSNENPGTTVEGKISPGSELQPGDKITIYERYF